MNNVKISFDIMPDGECVQNCYKHICFHMIFDVKMEDFKRKAIIIANGNTIKNSQLSYLL